VTACWSFDKFYRPNKYFYLDVAMGAQLNIKSDDAYQLASRLAELTGESLTSAVTAALRERLDREQRKKDVEAKVARMLATGREIRAHMGGPASSDHDWLYGPDGLPL
jgi:antitoxin VapB